MEIAVFGQMGKKAQNVHFCKQDPVDRRVPYGVHLAATSARRANPNKLSTKRGSRRRRCCGENERAKVSPSRKHGIALDRKDFNDRAARPPANAGALHGQGVRGMILDRRRTPEGFQKVAKPWLFTRLLIARKQSTWFWALSSGLGTLNKHEVGLLM